MNEDRKEKEMQNLMYPMGIPPNVSVPVNINHMSQQVFSKLAYN